MDDEVQGLNRLVREFLELTRIDRASWSSPPARPICGRCWRRRRRGWPRRRSSAATRSIWSCRRSCLLLNIDRARIEQVLLNLLQNALTFTPRGGRITLGAELRGDQVAIWVRDTGVGIAPEDLPHIFERFYKADHARTGGGTGLGLAIAKHLVERHGGQIGRKPARPGYDRHLQPSAGRGRADCMSTEQRRAVADGRRVNDALE